MSAPMQVGHVVAGKYELVRLLGQGSMGAVWVAHHQTLGEKVALKVLGNEPPDGGIEDRSTAAARFLFEAQVAARLSRKTRHVVRVTDHGEEDGVDYLVMELLEGQTLERRLMLRPISFGEVRAVVTQVARALEEAHAEGLIHRDLKPANIFLTRDEDGQLLVKLLDFGIARTMHTRVVSVPFATAGGLVWGTPGYMGPEQGRAAALDTRWDLWALATIAYEALTGELPLPGTEAEELLENLYRRRLIPIHERRPDLPAGLTEFFTRAFAEHIEQRFASASDLALAFERAIEKGGRSEETPLAVSMPGKKADTLFLSLDARGSPNGLRHRAAFVAIAMMLIVVAVIAGATLRRPRASRRDAVIAAAQKTPEPTAVVATPGVATPAETAALPQVELEQPVSKLQAPTSAKHSTTPPPATPRRQSTLAPAMPTSAAVGQRKPIDKSEVF
jgi:serine/threonine protein kinase